MEQYIKAISELGFKGEYDSSEVNLDRYSHDASMFEVRPKLIVFPKDSQDVEILVSAATKLKSQISNLSLTARSAGTDMSGAAINDSVIVDFMKYFNHLSSVTAKQAITQPGVFYRDFEKETLKLGALFPSYPASRDLCAMGGIVNNNSGGEKSLEYGKTENFVTSLKLVFSDGLERTVEPLNHKQLTKKLGLKDFEGEVYRKLLNVLEENYDEIKAAKPKVTKNSTGYNLWDVWDRKSQIFDLTKLIVGAQGTLGFTTEATFRLVPKRSHSGLLVLFLKDIDKLGDVITKVLEHHPATFESFDDVTLWMSIRFMPYFLKMLGPAAFIKLLLGLIPDGLMLLKGIPKLILMVEFNGNSVAEVKEQIELLQKDLNVRRSYYEITAEEGDFTEAKAEKFWIMRRQSFNLLRNKVKDKHTAPFIDDLVVPTQYLSQFLPKMRAIIKKYNLFATIAGHMGDGNFHIIPLMKLENKFERAKLLPAMKETNKLVLSYHGSLSGEHNDGLIRGPWLKEMYGDHMLSIFKEVKSIMDPQDIFNPKKKAEADWDYSFSHIREHF